MFEVILDFKLLTTLLILDVFPGTKVALFLIQVIDGRGLPFASHCNLTYEPTLKVVALAEIDTIEIGTAKSINKNHYFLDTISPVLTKQITTNVLAVARNYFQQREDHN